MCCGVLGHLWGTCLSSPGAKQSSIKPGLLEGMFDHGTPPFATKRMWSFVSALLCVCGVFFVCFVSPVKLVKGRWLCLFCFFQLLTFPNPATNASIASNYTVVSTSRSLQLMHYYCHCS